MKQLEIYKTLSIVPSNAIKTIGAGRLKGKSDINPQWRYEAMTEMFGLCGVGWKYSVVKKWTEQGSEGQIICFADIELFIKVDEEWSEAIPGHGGNMLIKKEQSGLYTSDEGYKMAITDALSTAAKMIGVAADVYRGVFNTKYCTKPQEPEPQEPKPELTIDSKQFGQAVEAIQSKKATFEKVIIYLKDKFTVPIEIEQELLKL